MHPANERLLDALIELIAEDGSPPLEAADRIVKDAKRYRWLRDGNTFKKHGFCIGQQTANGIVRYTLGFCDEQVDGAMNAVIETIHSTKGEAK